MRRLWLLLPFVLGCGPDASGNDAGSDAPIDLDAPGDSGSDATIDAATVDARDATIDGPPSGGLFVTITSPIDGAVTGAAVVVSYVATPGISVFSCTLDGAPVTCGPGSVTLSGLEAGPRSFTVIAEDDTGGTASDTISFIVDASPPIVTSLGASVIGIGAARVTFSLADASAIPEIHCRLDDGSFLPCGSGSNGARGYMVLASGNHRVAVYGIDAWGNADIAGPSAPPPAAQAHVDFAIP